MIKKELLKKFKPLDLVILIMAILLGLYFGWSNMEIIIFTVFIAIILHPIASRYLAAPAVFLLAIVPLLLVADKAERAEEFAIYAYYFLAMATIMGFYELRKKSASLKNSKR